MLSNVARGGMVKASKFFQKIHIYPWLLGLLLFPSMQTVQAQIWTNVPTVVINFNTAFAIGIYGSKCLDFGPAPQAAGAPVFIYDCNGTAAQQVIIEEVDAQHDVIL